MPINLKVPSELLRLLGMTIDNALNGKEALEMIYANHYDIVFMDHMMPVMDGTEAVTILRHGKEEYRTLPVIALKANATVEAEQFFRQSGFSDFISKHIQLPRITACIKKWLPQGKIRESTEEIVPVVEYPGAEDASRITIPGIDTQQGITNSGGPALFTELLGDVHDIIDKKCAEVENALAAQDINGFTITVHALKTTCRMIGAMDLADHFLTLEKLGRENNITKIQEYAPSVLADFRCLRPYLAPCVREKVSVPQGL